ncbi:hypothetical protein [Nitrosopumilus ureiphilus]|nr:hypothetical protein [Nitrosopumilus ureiphilus]
MPLTDINTNPVVLRWLSEPILGFPVMPFKVYRRQKNYEKMWKRLPYRLSNNVIQFDADMYAVELKMFSSAPIQVEFLDENDVVLKQETLNRENIYRFVKSGIKALRMSGTPANLSIQGITSHDYANLSDWEMIESVGFPVDSQFRSNTYFGGKQSFPSAPLNGYDAALLRLAIAKSSLPTMPSSPIASMPISWNYPIPERYLQFLGNEHQNEYAKNSILYMIFKCMDAADNATTMQRDYLHHLNMDGIYQQGTTFDSSSDTSSVDIPVVQLTLAMIGLDPFASTALGYGTIDVFPSTKKTNLEHDYMVVGTFSVFGNKFEIAALGNTENLSQRISNLTVTKKFQTPPLHRDGMLSETLDLRWNTPANPYSYLAVQSNRNEYFINPRVVGSPSLWVPSDIGDNSQISYVVSDFNLPLNNQADVDFMVIGVDVFGKWTNWIAKRYAPVLPPVLKPGLFSVVVEPKPNEPSKFLMEIDFSWDWSTRSPESIEFFGKFFPSDMAPPSVTSGFQTSNTDLSSTIDLKITFSEDMPYVHSSVGIVEILNPEDIEESMPERNIRYKLSLEIDCTFDNQSEISYVVYACGEEKIRPGQKSDFTNPLRAQILNPNPPSPPELNTSLLWTTPPDATKKARALLKWQPIAGAVGYAIWTSNESALKNVEGVSLNGDSIIERANSLISEVNSTKCISEFSRINSTLIPENRYEIEISGNSDIIYAYKVSAINNNNLESSKSNALLYAVPKVSKPAPPKLVLKNIDANSESSTNIRLTAIPGDETTLEGYRLFRVRNPDLMRVPGLTGPPICDVDDPNWTTISDVEDPWWVAKFGDSEDAEISETLRKYSEVEDVVETSWYPYYYQLTALGKTNSVAGYFGTESKPSAVVEGFNLPKHGPSISNVRINYDDSNNSMPIISFESNIPVKNTTVGIAKITLFKKSNSKFEHILTKDTDTIPYYPNNSSPITKKLVSHTRSEFVIQLNEQIDKLHIQVTDSLRRTCNELIDVVVE